MEMKCLTLSIGRNHPVHTLTQECLRLIQQMGPPMALVPTPMALVPPMAVDMALGPPMALDPTPVEWGQDYLDLILAMEQQATILAPILQVEFPVYILESQEEALQKKASLNLAGKFLLVLSRNHLWSLGIEAGRECLQLLLDSEAVKCM